MQALRVHAYGGPEAMVLDELPDPRPAAGEALVAVAFAGVNFYDTQQRSGFIKRDLPIALGLEGAGTVVAAGPDAGVVVGARVAWAQSPASYATRVVVPAHRLLELPANVSFEAAAAVLFQGMTAHHLACDTYALGAADTCVVHSAAGGVGTLLCQIAKLRGATVIGVVSTEAKARSIAGISDHVLRYADGDLGAAVKRLTGGRGADVVYDAVGEATFEASLASLRPRGLLAMYGEASGFVPPFDLRRLAALGSLYVTRTSLQAYAAARDEYLARARDLLQWLSDATLVPRIHGIYPLASAAEAHRALESRASTGKLLLRC